MFFKMRKGDGMFLVALAVFSALGFLLPGLRTSKFAGVALFGGWMAALMFLGPLVAHIGMLRSKQ